ncbi:MAG: carboxymuconolactone decarboxylase family protein [Chloroflexi bacterium]|nr:carboxymuconolactone decarboxylase family protein [Chloroflexota bacterium]
MPRISLIEQQQLPEDMRWLFDRLKDPSGHISTLWRVLGHNAQVLRGAMILGTALLQRSKLSPRLRELAILRTGYLTGATYEYYHHMPAARRAGATNAEIAAVPRGIEAPEYGPQERLVMALADAMSAAPPQVDDALVQQARTFLGEEELLELEMTIGYYNMLGRLMVAMDIQVEPDFDPNR